MQNKKTLNLFKATAVIFLTAVAFGLSACTTSDNQTTPQILVSSYVPYTIVKNLVKDKADITMLMPPGVEAHSYEPLPKDILKVKKAKTFFYIDKTSEPWAYDIKKEMSYELGPSTSHSKEMSHPWINFYFAFTMAEKAAEIIQKEYPSLNKEEIQKNLKDFEKTINSLRKNYSTKLENCKNRDIYHIGHSAFGWFAKNYDLNFIPLINSSEYQEPNPKDILEMIKQIKEKKIKYIFSEEALPPEMADLIASQTGAKVLMLYTIEHVTKGEFDAQVSYQDFMYKNLNNLVKGLECK